jgi:hypothetical protein
VAVSVINELRLGKIAWDRRKLLLNITVAALLSAVVGYFALNYLYDPAASLAQNIVTVGYLAIDVVTIFVLMTVLNMFRVSGGGYFYRSWILFALGLLVIMAGDMLYAVYYSYYIAGDLLYRQLDYFWITGYLLIGYTLVKQSAFMQRMKK